MSAQLSANAIGPRSDLARFPDPLDLLAAEHSRLRAICASLEALAQAERCDPAAARSLAAQLRDILPAHTALEEAELFPLLRSRAEPEDEIDKALGRLTGDHADVAHRTPAVLAALDRLAAGSDMTGPDRAALGTYAAAKLRHLTLEIAVIVPLARERLTDADLRALRAAAAEGRARPADASA